jgi:hypothetical protein
MAGRYFPANKRAHLCAADFCINVPVNQVIEGAARTPHKKCAERKKQEEI